MTQETTGQATEAYRGKRVLITGGLGFLGSNLAGRLVALEASVRIIDALIPGMGGNLCNIDGLQGRVEVAVADLRDPEALVRALDGVDVIFNLAGQVSHIDSMRHPLDDLGINVESQLRLLEACRARTPEARIVFTSTRHLYGRPERVPVDEAHPILPPDVNGIHKAAAESYHQLYHRVFGLPICVLRVTNAYGPRQLIQHDRHGFIGWFIRLALEDREITVFGDGSQVRDFVYVDDVVEAMLQAGLSERCLGGTYNVGGSQPIAHRDLVALLIELAGSGRVRFVDWPADRKAIDIGSVYLDSTRLRQAIGWEPRTPLREGLARTLDFYRTRMACYTAPAPSRWEVA
ncbi:MAG: NAD-dependent epimerase/dehydratase family protein [Acidobacteriota bacterium]|nr:NAD-dependent epimerase/dehydratase family protein [Acidobacteriota bacterium]